MGIIRETAAMSDTEQLAARNSNFLYLLSQIYPIGSIYISTVSTSPSILFGGTWERIKDTFLLAAGTTYTAGATGGEATHTLTINEMPSHQHFLPVNVNEIEHEQNTDVFSYAGWKSNYNNSATLSNGGNQPHNNMPPYLAVYVWKRTA